MGRKTNNYCKVFVIGLGISALLQTSCTDTIDCKYTANRSVKVNFTQLNTRNTLVDTTVSSFSVVTASGVLLYDSVSARQIQLPLSQLSDTSLYYFYFDSIAIDTFRIFVQRNIEMISPECGFNTRFTIDSAQCTANNILRIVVVDKAVGENATTDRNINLVVKKRNQAGTR